MNNISYQIIVGYKDKQTIKLIADWYLSEWNIAAEKTILQLLNFSTHGVPFQVLMKVDGFPIATGGLYDHVGLLDREPRFKIYKPWLALIYTTNANRNKGYGTMLCEKIQEISKDLGLKEIFLFTHTAESLYKRLGWQQLERIELSGKNIVVMKKEL
ncbi:MAG: GNAT family N-acetyltransferase [Bacteroidetes bacterium]|nr:GNAT family N-acetyltransferase [Bacteroidota bacterium]